MNSQNRIERLVTEWLSDMPATAPDQVLEQFLTQLATAPQRRRWALTGRFTMFGSRLFAWGAAVAVAVIALIVVFNVWGGGDDPGPGATSSPSPAPPLETPTPIASAPSPAPLSEGPLVPGAYVYDGDGLRVTLAVPAGWEGIPPSGVGKPPFELPDGVNLGFQQPTVVYSDPCLPSGVEVPGPTVDDLVTALADLPNVSASPAEEITISGFSGKHLEFVVETEGIDCVMAIYSAGSFTRAAETGQHQDLWILDVGGTRLVIDGATFPDTPPEDRAELLAIVDALVIEATP